MARDIGGVSLRVTFLLSCSLRETEQANMHVDSAVPEQTLGLNLSLIDLVSAVNRLD